MKLQRDKLHQYQRRITVITARETEVAKACLRANDKQRALLALRRKKYQESLLARTDAQLAQLEQLTSDVEFSLVQKDVLYGLQQGTTVLKEIHKEMGGVEGVEKLLGESEEARAYSEEVTELLAGRMSNQEEDEVEDELEALVREEAVKQGLPSAPVGALKEEEVQSKEEVRKERAKRRAKEREQRPEPIAA